MGGVIRDRDPRRRRHAIICRSRTTLASALGFPIRSPMEPGSFSERGIPRGWPCSITSSSQTVQDESTNFRFHRRSYTGGLTAWNAACGLRTDLGRPASGRRVGGRLADQPHHLPIFSLDYRRRLPGREQTYIDVTAVWVVIFARNSGPGGLSQCNPRPSSSRSPGVRVSPLVAVELCAINAAGHSRKDDRSRQPFHLPFSRINPPDSLPLFMSAHD